MSTFTIGMKIEACGRRHIYGIVTGRIAHDTFTFDIYGTFVSRTGIAIVNWKKKTCSGCTLSVRGMGYSANGTCLGLFARSRK